MNKFTKAAVVSAALALLAQGAYAQDLIVGFTGNNATTPANDLILDTGLTLASLSSSSSITLLGTSLGSTATFNANFTSANSTTFGAVSGNDLGGQGSYIAIGQTRTGANALGVKGTESTPSAVVSRTTLEAAADGVAGLTLGVSVSSGGNSFASQNQPLTAGTVANEDGIHAFTTTISGTTAQLDIFQETEGVSANGNYIYEGQLDLDLSKSSGGNYSGAALEFIPAGYVAPVPEPGTFALLGMGGFFGLLFRRYVRKNVSE